MEKQRITVRLAQSVASQRLATARLNAEDSEKDLGVFERATQQLGKAGEYAKLLEPLVSGARAEERKLQARLLLVQTKQQEGAEARELSRLEGRYREKRRALSQSLQQRFTAERSMEVLTAALEDESAYLAELETTCGLGKKVYERLEEGPLVVLNRSLAHIAQHLGRGAQHSSSHAMASGSMASAAASPEEDARGGIGQEAEATSPLTLSKALQALPANAPVSAESQTGFRAAVAAPVQPPPARPTLATTGAAEAKTKAMEATLRRHAATVASGRAAAHAQTKAAAHPVPRGRAGEGHGAATPPHHKSEAAHLHVRHAAEQAPSKRLRKQAQAAKPREQAGIQEPRAASASSPHSPSLAPAAEPAKSSQAQVGRLTEQPEAQESPEAAAASPEPLSGQASEHREEVTAELAAPPQKPRVQHAAKEVKKSKDSAFMDGVYDSASGNMPSAYNAWTPEGSAPAAKKLATRALDGSPTKRMSAILGGDGSPSPEEEGARPAVHQTQSTHLRRSQPSKPKPVAAPSAQSSDRAAQRAEGPSVAAAALVGQEGRSDDGSASVVDRDEAPAPKGADADGDASSPGLARRTPAARTSAASRPPEPQSKTAVPSEPSAAGAGDDLGDADETAASSGPKRSGARTPPSLAAEKAPQLGFDSDEVIDKAFPTPKLSIASLSAQKMQSAPSHGSLMQRSAAGRPKQDALASPASLPTQYAAWSPADEQAPARHETSLEQMVAEFKSDDADDEDTAAAHRAKRPDHPGGTAGPGPAVAKARGASMSKPDEADVVYDDDDLPRHRKRPISMDLQGGWKSFIVKDTAASKAHKPKLDPDIAIMNSLYSSDGGLPQQYTAWQPSGGDADRSTATHASDDIKAAAKELESEVAFTQVSSVTLGLGPVARLIRHAIEDAGGNDQNGLAEITPLVFLESATNSNTSRVSVANVLLEQYSEESATNSNTSRVSVANVLLEQYSEALRSPTLGQLARAKLSQPKLAELWQRLQKVDPLMHSGGAAAAPGKHQAQAERWCQYFMQNEQSAAPVHKAVAMLEKDSNALAESTAQRAAMTDEADARHQLLRTVDQDVGSLAALLNAARQEQATSVISLSQQDLMALQGLDLNGTKDILAFQGAVESFRTAHAEIADLLEAALNKRTAVLEAQRTKLAQLKKDMQTADETVEKKQAVLAQSQKAVSTAQIKLGGIQASCDATLSGLSRRRHAGHMEAHAVEVALKVLGSR